MKLTEVKKFNEMNDIEASTECLKKIKESFAESLNVVFGFMASILNVSHVSEDLAVKIVERTGVCKSILECRAGRDMKNNSTIPPSIENIAKAAGLVLESEMNGNKTANLPDEIVLDHRNFSVKFIYGSEIKIKYSVDKIAVKAGLDKLSYKFGNPAYASCFKKIVYPDLNKSGCNDAKDAGILDANDYTSDDIPVVNVVVTFKDVKEEK